MDIMLVVLGCSTQIPFSTGTFPVTMTRSLVQCVLHPDSIDPWDITGTFE